MPSDSCLWYKTVQGIRIRYKKQGTLNRQSRKPTGTPLNIASSGWTVANDAILAIGGSSRTSKRKPWMLFSVHLDGAKPELTEHCCFAHYWWTVFKYNCCFLGTGDRWNEVADVEHKSAAKVATNAVSSAVASTNGWVPAISRQWNVHSKQVPGRWVYLQDNSQCEQWGD